MLMAWLRLWSVFTVVRPGKCHQALLFFTGCSNSIICSRKKELHIITNIASFYLKSLNCYQRVNYSCQNGAAWANIIHNFCYCFTQNEAHRCLLEFLSTFQGEWKTLLSSKHALWRTEKSKRKLNIPALMKC